MVKCSYGCNKEAKHFFKNGNGCCEISPNKCESKRKLDSLKKKGKFLGTQPWKIDGFIYKPWNKGKTGVYSDETRKKISESLKGKSTGKGSTEEIETLRKQNISKSMKNNPLAGGIRKGSGRGKKGWYCGYWCDSSWELAWVIYHIDHNIKFERNNEPFQYSYNGKQYKYYPDFIKENVYYEIKGRRGYAFLEDKEKEKIKQFDLTLIVLYEKEMKMFLKYVIDKYGKDFIKKYE